MNNLLHNEGPRFRKSNRFAVAVAWLVILIGLISLTGWISGTMWLTRFADTQVPIAPITIFLFVICSLALLALIRFQKTNKNRLLFLLPASLVVLLSGFLAISRMMNIPTGLEHFFNFPQHDLPFMIEHISLVTALIFVTSGCIFLLSASKSKTWQTVRVILILVMLIASAILFMGYMYGAPFYYQGDFIPPSALATGMFLMIFLGLITTADKETYIVRRIQSGSIRARLFKLFLPVTLALIFLEDFITIRILPILGTHPVYTVLVLELIFITVAGYLFYWIARNFGNSLDLANRELQKTNELLHAILDSIPVRIFWKNSDSVYVGCNKSFAEDAGFSSPDDIIGKDDLSLPWSAVAGNYRNDDCSVLESGESKILYEEQKTGPGGIVNYLLTSKVPLKDDAGKVVGVLGSYLDISERKRVENALKENDITLGKLSKHVPGMIYQFMKRPDGSYCVPFTTDAIREIFGCSPQDVKDDFSPIIAVFHPDDRPEVLRSIAESAELLTPWQCEYRVNVPGKETRWMYGQSTPEKLADGTILWHGFNTDITERKRIESEIIRAKEAAEESNRLKSAFLANMSHEIRTPMNGILGFTNLLSEPDLTGEEKDRYIDIIHKSGQRMLSTLNDIIEVSMIETGQLSLLISEMNTYETMVELCNFLRPEAEKKGLLFHVEAEPSGSVVHTDKGKFTSIVTNLIKNAIKYTDSGFIHVKLIVTAEQLKFSVKDSGIGIPENKLEAIFNRFEQVDPDPSRIYEGSGLGLSISKSYAEFLGGTIHVRSTPGKGSVFTLTLPLHGSAPSTPVPAVQPSLQASDQTDNQKINILVVEDDQASIEYLRIILQELARDLHFAVTGEEAVRVASDHPDLDVILMDIRIPGGDGYETTRAIRAFNPGVTIIAQTAHAAMADRQKALEAGCDDHIAKPVKKEDLLALIRKHIKN